ncbi:hypothetical protein PanWU01x14_223670, partial [Parasponia andersonii]
ETPFPQALTSFRSTRNSVHLCSLRLAVFDGFFMFVEDEDALPRYDQIENMFGVRVWEYRMWVMVFWSWH